MQSSSPRCLLVDDDLDDQEIFGMALDNIDIAVECHFANDGVHAVQKLLNDADFVPCYIFVDINMPRMNGLQCLKEIKKIERINAVPVYMYSTSEDEQTVAEAKRCGAAGIIIKPTSLPSLVEVLKGIINPEN